MKLSIDRHQTQLDIEVLRKVMHERFGVLRQATNKIPFCWVVMQCNLVEISSVS